MPADLQESHAPLAEISQGPSAFELFLDRNQKNLVILSILLAIGTAAVVVYQGIEKSRQETAGAAFNKAEDLAALQAVVNEHAKTTAAQSAMVLLAERQWNEGQQDAAIATLRKFVSDNPSHPAVPSAQASLGSKLMTQGKAPEATKVFEEVAADSNARYIAPYALICLGDIAKIAGDFPKAEASYNRVKTEFAESSFAETATRRITSLKAKAPVEIEAPPAPKVDVQPAPTPGAPNASSAPTIEVAPVQETAPAEGSEKNTGETPAAPQQ